jgi:hypothetical protein
VQDEPWTSFSPIILISNARIFLRRCDMPLACRGARGRTVRRLMKFLVDMNLSPSWVSFLADAGFAAVHWSKVGRGDAPDIEVMQWAAEHDHVVLTADLDFGAILAATQRRQRASSRFARIFLRLPRWGVLSCPRSAKRGRSSPRVRSCLSMQHARDCACCRSKCGSPIRLGILAERTRGAQAGGQHFGRTNRGAQRAGSIFFRTNRTQGEPDRGQAFRRVASLPR